MTDGMPRERDGRPDGDLAVLFARFAAERSGGAREVELAAWLLGRAVAAGDVCLDLRAAAEGAVDLPPGAGGPPPDLETWTRILARSPVVGAPGAASPLVLDAAGRLYLHRYWQYEDLLARRLLELAAARAEVDEGRLAGALTDLFPGGGSDPAQRRAAEAVARRRLAVVTGGPGTGKTTTAVRSLAALAAAWPGPGPGPRVALAAPTGKAAARLGEAAAALARELPPEGRAALPAAGITIHRLLGPLPGGTRFRHGPERPLPHDVVVVDEASMVDLPLMAKLAAALGPGARLVLLGDRDQLASVEAGAVLADVCDAAAGPLSGAVVVLERSHRFEARGGIGAVSRAVRDGDGDAAVRLLSGAAGEAAVLRPLPPPGRFEAALFDAVEARFRAVAAAGGPGEALERLSAFRVLCALRRGSAGAEAVNALVARRLSGRSGPAGGPAWFRGLPVLVTRNDPVTGLWNGDVGVFWPDPEAGGEFRVFFEGGEGGLRRFPPSRLPAHEPAFALTVHKSQGSEFDEVLLVLSHGPSEVLTRELLYTGLTRARRRVAVWSDPGLVRAAAARPTRRASGLADALRRGAAGGA
ncbi:exodeoxyribonuclease V subunit alpha [Dissulfurirhabdus thermomarina]|uniref:Exodeoxyribonuclease V subunit alpha n=1 Tax=Dissulfurirhabdus thermomarina TaxID=1765737 RepID=A0A6N9TSK9_DISTH|nr:exodeoxyribonuclease V subunit alpha [Dissulfurirhabdus thermomarina]NDY41536.1 exodeoxyribonuclease V subunit alpha [Dissulfurirhabdus thermomarina]NMX22945.1 exodeoxyribonuclease V subunit alpha [Dissulfurirhabdus thermomarina]